MVTDCFSTGCNKVTNPTIASFVCPVVILEMRGCHLVTVGMTPLFAALTFYKHPISFAPVSSTFCYQNSKQKPFISTRGGCIVFEIISGLQCMSEKSYRA